MVRVAHVVPSETLKGHQIPHENEHNSISTFHALKPSPVEYVADFDDPATHLLIDVRTPEEFASGHINGSVNIPVEEMQGRLDEIPGDTPIVVYCRSGNRSATAARILTDADYAPVYDLGGIQDWVAEGLPITVN